MVQESNAQNLEEFARKYSVANLLLQFLTKLLSNVCKGARFLEKLQTKHLNSRTDYNSFRI